MQLKEKLPEKYFEENLAVFAGLLRQEGLPVGTTEMVDALSALQRVDLSSRDDFKTALRATLVKSSRDQALFSRIFDLFFAGEETHQQRADQLDSLQSEQNRKIEQASDELQFKGENLGLSQKELSQYSALSSEQRERLQDFMQKTEEGKNVESRFRPLLETVVKSHLRYCRTQEQEKSKRKPSYNGIADGAGTGGEDYLREIDIQDISSSELPAAELLLQRLSRKLAIKILRRKRTSTRSGPLDLRRSLRDNMRFGGIIFDIKHKPKRRLKMQIVLLCDVSASMKRYSSFVIHFLYGLREAVRDLSCFSFSDNLENLTPEVKGRTALKQLLEKVVRRSKTWGGGTNIGHALEQLKEKHPGALNNRTTLIVVSDTKTVALDLALEHLQIVKQGVKRVIWLNPLPAERWPDYRSVGLVADLVEMWPCSTISQLEDILLGRL